MKPEAWLALALSKNTARVTETSTKRNAQQNVPRFSSFKEKESEKPACSAALPLLTPQQLPVPDGWDVFTP